MRNKRFTFVYLPTLPVLTAFFILIFSVSGYSNTAKPKQKSETPINVKILNVRKNSVSDGLYFSGTIEAERTIDLSFLSAGKVLRINVNPGKLVKKGQILAQLDSQLSSNNLQIAKAKQNQVQDAYNRLSSLYKHGNLPKIKMVEISTNKKQADAALRIAEKEYKNSSLTAPCDGYISKKSVEVGDNVFPGQKVLQLVSIDKLYAEISVSEKDIVRIKKGSNAVVKLSQYNIQLKGKVTDVGMSVDILSRTYAVRVLIDNKDTKILPGMLCDVYIDSKDVGPLQIVIPATALKLDAKGKKYVYVIDRGTMRAKKRYVVVQEFSNNGIVVSSGIDLNDVIVSEGVQKLDDGILVKFLED